LSDCTGWGERVSNSGRRLANDGTNHIRKSGAQAAADNFQPVIIGDIVAEARVDVFVICAVGAAAELGNESADPVERPASRQAAQHVKAGGIDLAGGCPLDGCLQRARNGFETGDDHGGLLG